MITIGTQVKDRVYNAFEIEVEYYDKCHGNKKVSLLLFTGLQKSDKPISSYSFNSLTDCHIDQVEALYHYIANINEESLEALDESFDWDSADRYMQLFVQSIPHDSCSGMPYNYIESVSLYYHDSGGVKYEANASVD